MRNSRKVNSFFIPGLMVGVLFHLGSASAVGAIKTFRQYAEETGLREVASSLHFSVFSPEKEFSKKALDCLERSLQKIGQDLKLKRTLGGECLVFIWESRADYQRRIARFAPANLEDSGGFAISAAEREPHRVYLFKSDRLFDVVIPHELAHLTLEATLNPSRRYEIPIWLHEGFAQCQEEKPFLPVAREVVAAYKNGELLPVEAFSRYKHYPQSPEHRGLFYRESETLVQFLLENQTHEGEFFELCQRLVFWGDDLASAVRSKYKQRFPDLRRLEELWINYLQEYVKRGG